MVEDSILYVVDEHISLPIGPTVNPFDVQLHRCVEFQYSASFSFALEEAAFVDWILIIFVAISIDILSLSVG